jgi:hypothetical protein
VKILNRVVRVGLIVEMTFEQRLESKIKSYPDVWGKSVPGRRNSH